MSILRTLVRRSLLKAGIERIRYPSIVELIKHEKFRTVIDVGANEGQYGAELREGGFGGRIASFEPIAAVYERLADRVRADPLWDCYRLGVGDEAGDQAITVCAESVYSSFKDPSAYTRQRFVGAAAARTEVVPVVRLDEFLAEHPAYLDECLLKIDAQGFEKEVLLGAGESLAGFRGVQLELPVRQLYAGQDGWIAMIEWMAQRGYAVAMVKENGWDWTDMRLHELDALFLRD